eukprot:tig00000488_g1349.t1
MIVRVVVAWSHQPHEIFAYGLGEALETARRVELNPFIESTRILTDDFKHALSDTDGLGAPPPHTPPLRPIDLSGSITPPPAASRPRGGPLSPSSGGASAGHPKKAQ